MQHYIASWICTNVSEETADSSEMLEHIYQTTQHHIPEDLVSCLAYSLSLKMEETHSSEMLLTFNGVHGVISQKIEPFITTAVRTSYTASMFQFEERNNYVGRTAVFHNIFFANI
jgi:hypothetical protein